MRIFFAFLRHVSSPAIIQCSGSCRREKGTPFWAELDVHNEHNRRAVFHASKVGLCTVHRVSFCGNLA